MGTPDVSPQYDLALPGQIVFGWGRRAELGRRCKPYGRRALIVVGSKTLAASDYHAEVIDALKSESIEPIEIAYSAGEPTVEQVDRLSRSIRDAANGHAFVLALGGGSAIDLAKAVAAAATQSGGYSIREYLEGVGTRTLHDEPLPLVAVPTTAGTGSEATRNAVITVSDPPLKKSLRDIRLLPRIALIDPELTVTTSITTTAHSGLDAITQLIESYISRRASPITKALCLEGLKGVDRALLLACREPASRQARERMSHAALLSGLALANSGLGLAHAVAAALGAHFGVPHGLACAMLLPLALRTNMAYVGPAYTEIVAAIRTDWPDDAPEETLLQIVDRLLTQLEVPHRLSQFGVRADHLPMLVAASQGSSMQGNPRHVTNDQLSALLENRL